MCSSSPKSPSKALRVMEAMDELEQEASILGVDSLDSKSTVFLGLAHVFPGYQALRASHLVRAHPQEGSSLGIDRSSHSWW